MRGERGSGASASVVSPPPLVGGQADLLWRSVSSCVRFWGSMTPRFLTDLAPRSLVSDQISVCNSPALVSRLVRLKQRLQTLFPDRPQAVQPAP